VRFVHRTCPSLAWVDLHRITLQASGRKLLGFTCLPRDIPLTIKASPSSKNRRATTTSGSDASTAPLAIPSFPIESRSSSPLPRRNHHHAYPLRSSSAIWHHDCCMYSKKSIGSNHGGLTMHRCLEPPAPVSLPSGRGRTTTKSLGTR
jgi:hypothetical protein